MSSSKITIQHGKACQDLLFINVLYKHEHMLDDGVLTAQQTHPRLSYVVKSGTSLYTDQVEYYLWFLPYSAQS